MKLLVLFITLISSFLSFSQEIDPAEAQFIWENHVEALLTKDVDGLINHTEFPLITFMGELDPEDLTNSFDELFSEELITDLGIQTMNDFQAVIDETNELNYILVLMTSETLDNGEKVESALLVTFAKFDDVWKLSKIDMAG